MSSNELPMLWHALRLPKHGNTDAECEDAWAADPERGRFAVADGASESAFSGLWAQLLVEECIAAPQPGDLASWLDTARKRWLAEVAGLELPWYLEEKRKQGAFAALLGLRLLDAMADRPCRWRATAVGDCCLVWVRQSLGMRTFPIRKSSEFGSDPRLLCSRMGGSLTPMHCSGSLIGGDRLFLMTDALAQWFLQTHEKGGRPWKAVATVLSAERPEEAFAGWIEELRNAEGLRDDDVTLLSLTLPTLKEEPS